MAALERKRALIARIHQEAPDASRLVLPSEQTARQPYFGFRLILGAAYDPIIDPSQTWIHFGCVSADPRVAFDEDEFGVGLVRVHAIVYEEDRNTGFPNYDTGISTAETAAIDEGGCDLNFGVDAGFIEIPRTFKAAFVSLFSVRSRRQYVEVVEHTERVLAR